MELKHHVLLFGITGGTGKLIAENLLAGGHTVTCVVRKPAKLAIQHPRLLVREGDITKAETFAGLAEHCDTVISAIGDRTGQPTTLYSTGLANVIHAMDKTGPRRLICISAQAIEISPAVALWQKWLTKYIIQRLFKHSYEDMRVMELLVRSSNVNWTVMRPPMLKNIPPTGKYNTAINKHLKQPISISRADLAAYICSIIDKAATFKSIIEIAY